MLFIKALVAAYLRVIHLEEEPIKGFKDITTILENYKIVSPEEFKEARFAGTEGKASSASELDPELIYCTVTAHDDIEM